MIPAILDLHTRYRALGADPPGGDPRRAHGVAMEGYFWRLTDARAGRVVVALCGVCRDGRGPWGTVALAVHPGGVVRVVDLPRAGADPARLGVWAADADGQVRFRGDAERLDVDLGPDAQLHLGIDARPHRRRPWLGGSGVAHLVPGLSQYWHPHLLRATASGDALIGDATVSFTEARVYAEKNWGAGGFPTRWWWGQAHDFAGDDVTVAFAGGEVRVGPLALEATGVVVRLRDRMIRLGNPLLAPARMEADGERWSLQARGPIWSVALDGRGAPGGAHVLPVPDLAAGRSVAAAHEHLAGALSLVVRRRGRIVYSGESRLAGLEVGSAPFSVGDELREQLGGLSG